MLPAYNLSNSFTHEPTRPLSAPEAHEKQDFFQRISLGSPSSCSAHLPPAEAAIDKAAVREDENFAPGPGKLLGEAVALLGAASAAMGFIRNTRRH